MTQAPKTADQFPLRLPDGMRDLIKDNAKANNRTMNSEIIAVLERYVEERSEQMKIRLPSSLKQRLADVAYYARRSVNAQVVLFIEQGLGLATDNWPPPSPHERPWNSAATYGEETAK